MAIQDFRFVGRTTENSNNAGQLKIAYDIAQGNGASTSTNGGYVMEGQSVLHTSLSGAITTCGDYCRGWKWSDGRFIRSGYNYNYNWAGMAFLGTRSLGAKLTPDSGSAFSAAATFANSTGKRTEATAISIRATVRIDAMTGSQNVSSSMGATVGVFCGARPISLTAKYSTTDGTSNDNTMYCANQTDSSVQFAGYALLLSSIKHMSQTIYGGDGTNRYNNNLGQQGVRLVLTQNANDRSNLGFNDEFQHQQRMQVATGTYQFNKWYRIRMDVTPLPGTDKIEAYTAPATDTIGSETWTKVKTHYVFAGQSQFWIKTHAADQKGIGYCVSSHNHVDGDSTDRNHNVFIDAFTVFSKKISA